MSHKIARLLLDFAGGRSVCGATPMERERRHSDQPDVQDLGNLQHLLLLPASAFGPPRGCGGGGMCRRIPQEEIEMTKSKPAHKAKSASTTKTPRKAANDH